MSERRILTTENYQYRLDEERRNRIMRTVEHDHLAEMIQANRPVNERGFRLLLHGAWKLVCQAGRAEKRVMRAAMHRTNTILQRHVMLLILVFVLAVIAMPQGSALAQDPYSVDAGEDSNSDAGLHFRVGNFYYIKGDYARAVKEFTLTIQLVPGYGYAYAARGDSYAALGQYAAALDDYNRAIAIYPDLVSAYCTRGQLYQLQGNFERARQDYQQAIQLKSNYLPSYWGLLSNYADQLSQWASYVLGTNT
jgi:tetratricopeptide (TPR) repeat protein